MIRLTRDFRILAWASAFVLASCPAPRAFAAADAGHARAPVPAGAKPATNTATCSSDAKDCQAGADAQRPEVREPQGGRSLGLCGTHSPELEASLRMRCPRLYGPLFA